MEIISIKARLCNACGNGEFSIISRKSGDAATCKKCGHDKFKIVARTSGVGCKCVRCGMEYRPKDLFGIIGRVCVRCICGSERNITDFVHNGAKGEMLEENWEC